MGGSCLQPQDLVIAIVKMILSLFFFCICGIVTSSPVAEVEEDRGLVGDIAMGILVGKIQEMLGITTTPKPRPIIDGIAGLLGGETTTTAAPPTVAGSLEVDSLDVLATTKRPPAQRPQLPPLRSVVDFLEGASSAARGRRPQQLQPSAEVSWVEDFFAR